VRITGGRSDSEGIARICDVPRFTRVDINVGNGPCGNVTVRNLYPLWLITFRVSVTYELCAGHDLFLAPLCHLVVRVRDQRGKPLPDAGLTLPSKPEHDEGTLISDRYGRIFRVIHRGEMLRGSLEKQGYAAAQVAFECTRLSDAENEQIIVLKKLEGSKGDH
jgi:hypothetical protein